MPTFNPARYGPVFAALYDHERAGELAAGTPDNSRRVQLDAAGDASLFAGREIRDPAMADCCRSGLWLLHGFLDASHTLSQAIATPAGSYWHGIMHRREGDYSNAKYWFRRAGPFPTYERLAAEATREARQDPADPSAPLLAGLASWDPARFVDLCQSACQNKSSALCSRVARVEWCLLFDHCYRAAVEELDV